MLTTRNVLGVSNLTAKTSDGTTSNPIDSSLKTNDIKHQIIQPDN